MFRPSFDNLWPCEALISGMTQSRVGVDVCVYIGR